MAESASCVFMADDYTELTSPMTRSYFQHFKDKVETILADMKLAEDETLTVGDYGCYDGYTSMDLILSMIGVLREINETTVPVHIIYEDLPTNDFNSLIKKVSRQTEFQPSNKIFLSMCPTSFYEQCLPDNTFNWIFSSFSVHFLSTSNISYKDSLYKFPGGTEQEKEVVSAQAAADWQTFLLMRAKEMKSGGCLMLSFPAVDAENKIHLQNMWIAMTKVWRKLETEGLLSQSEYKAANFTGYDRNEEELRAPFAKDSPVPAAGLYIQSLDIVHRQYHYDDRDKRSSWAGNFVSIIRQWTEHIFDLALKERTSESRNDLLKMLYERLTNRLQEEADPTCRQWDAILAYLVIRKQ